jgi:hypothetical protein
LPPGEKAKMKNKNIKKKRERIVSFNVCQKWIIRFLKNFSKFEIMGVFFNKRGYILHIISRGLFNNK